MFCPRCGEKNPDGAKFCAACGAPFARPAAGPVPASAPAPARRAPVAAIVAAVVAVLVVGSAAFGVWLAFFSPWPIDEKNFPDPALRAAVAATADTNHDGQLSRDEGRAVTSLSVEGAASLAGLGRYFPNLTQLTVTGSALTSLDVSDLPALTGLDAATEPLAALDVSANAALGALRVPDSTQVSGLESTKLHESWVPASVEERYDTGYATTYAVERDAQGRVTARSAGDGDNGTRWEYTYDEQGHLVEEQESTSAYGHDYSTTTTFAYDANGRLAEQESYDGMYAYYYTYDDAGRLVAMSMGGVDDPTSRTTYAYDDAGRLTSRLYTYKSDRGMFITFTYDDAGNLVQAEETDQTLGRIYQTTTYERDAAGNLTRVSATNFYDDPAPVSFAYDDANRLTSASATLSGTTYTATATYDERGNLAQVVEQVDGGRTTTYAATYTRFFVAEGGREPDSGITFGIEDVPLVGAQRTSLVNVWATPAVVPNPEPNALPGDSMILLF